MKKTVFLEAALLRKAEGLARRMRVSRSRLFATALAEFIERRRSQELLEAANRAFADARDGAEKRLRRAMLRQQRRRVQGQW